MAGGYGAGDPPDPIPNSEVKTRCADGTAGATRWESTAPPAYLEDPRPLRFILEAGVWRLYYPHESSICGPQYVRERGWLPSACPVWKGEAGARMGEDGLHRRLTASV